MPRYFADRSRHLVALPYTRDNLLAMADDLNIPRAWLHRHRTHEHIDIPVRSQHRILSDPRVTIVIPQMILAITRGADPNDPHALDNPPNSPRALHTYEVTR